MKKRTDKLTDKSILPYNVKREWSRLSFTPLASMLLAEHFAKWGAEHLKK